MAVFGNELIHFILFGIAFITPIAMFYLTFKIKEESFRNIVLLYALAFFFSAFRWAGGSMVAMQYEFAATEWFQTIWFFAGLAAALLGILATSKLYGFLKERESFFLGRT